jgi:splicing factor 3A subunit 1
MVIAGLIRPPPDIRVVADRTASYVAKNGRAFEARILQSGKGKTPKFAFLQPTSPFHAYYEERITFYENGGEDGVEKQEEKTEVAKESKKKSSDNKNPTGVVRKKEKTQKASAIDPVAKALLSQRAKIAQTKSKENEHSEKAEDSSKEPVSIVSLLPPPPLELVNIVAPLSLSAAQIETVQLVAHFTALDGKGGPFLHQLTLREWTNSEYSFCQPRHAHFAYFSALVDAYRRILRSWTSSTIDAPEDDNSIHKVLDEAAYRAEFEREMEHQKLQQEEGEILAIDWHDFVVVETIDFPMDEVVELSMLPPPPTTTPTKKQIATEESGPVGNETYEEEDEETIRVVPSYTPKVVGPSKPQEARAIDPITGKSVSVADMPEHMRIQLLDPKWAEEKKKFQEKQKDSNLVGGDAIVSNISRFAKARGDLFGKSVRS